LRRVYIIDVKSGYVPGKKNNNQPDYSNPSGPVARSTVFATPR
jgi:hypothetical protein